MLWLLITITYTHVIKNDKQAGSGLARSRTLNADVIKNSAAQGYFGDSCFQKTCVRNHDLKSPTE